jgi:hypothetical protein
MINKQKAIDNIIEDFNWEKVHKTMTALNWKWHDSKGESPTIGMLFKCAVSLLHDAYDGAVKEKINYSAATGGFYARAYVDEETKEIYELRLSFEICNWSYDEEDI